MDSPSIALHHRSRYGSKSTGRKLEHRTPSQQSIDSTRRMNNSTPK